MPLKRSPLVPAVAALLCSVLLAGCGVGQTKPVNYEPESFESSDTHSRSFAATEAQTCEAARRALLSQGYMISSANSDGVVGRKSFQPASEVHVEVEFRIVCAREANRKDGSRSTIAFASALQDRYAIKKVNNAASVGVGAIGSLSLPFSSSDDAMVKVASQTLTDDILYDRFFGLVERFLPEAIAGMPPDPAPAAAATPAKARPSLQPVMKPEAEAAAARSATQPAAAQEAQAGPPTQAVSQTAAQTVTPPASQAAAQAVAQPAAQAGPQPSTQSTAQPSAQPAPADKAVVDKPEGGKSDGAPAAQASANHS